MNGLYVKINPATSYFPTTESCSIIGSNRLNFRVRDGNGCDPTDNITGKLGEAVVSCRWSVVRKELTTGYWQPTTIGFEFSNLISDN